MLAVDISNWNGVLTQDRLAEWRNQGIGLVIPQAVSPPAGYPPGVTRQQIEACALAGMPTDAYLWVWTHSAVEADIEAKLSLLDGLEHLVGRLWLDCEDTAGATVEDRTDAIDRAISVMDAWSVDHGKPLPGIYTGRWWWQGYVADTTVFRGRDLWDADYDGVDDIFYGFVAYGGWSKRALKQYVGSPLDTNVLSAAEEARVLGSVSPDPAPAPECDWGWVAKKSDVVSTAGQLLTVADQLLAEANRASGPRKTVVRQLATGEMKPRVERILA